MLRVLDFLRRGWRLTGSITFREDIGGEPGEGHVAAPANGGFRVSRLPQLPARYGVMSALTAHNARSIIRHHEIQFLFGKFAAFGRGLARRAGGTKSSTRLNPYGGNLSRSTSEGLANVPDKGPICASH